MELAIQLLFLVLGFCAALVVGGVVRWSRSKGVPKGLSVDDGSVRLDCMGKVAKGSSSAPIAQLKPQQSGGEAPQGEAPAPQTKVARKSKRKGK